MIDHIGNYGLITSVDRSADVIAALERNGWQVTRTAAELGLSDHASLLKIMRRHGLSKETRRNP